MLAKAHEKAARSHATFFSTNHSNNRQRRKQDTKRNTDDCTPRQSLIGNVILDDSQMFILDPDSAIEDLANHHLRAILLHPDLMAVRISGAERLDCKFGFLATTTTTTRFVNSAAGLRKRQSVGAREGSLIAFKINIGVEFRCSSSTADRSRRRITEGGGAAVVGELLPGPQVAVSGDVEDEADAVGAGEEEAEAQEPGGEGPDAPPAGFEGEQEEDGDEEAEEDVEEAEDFAEDHAGLVAVDGAPADEVWVGVVAERL